MILNKKLDPIKNEPKANDFDLLDLGDFGDNKKEEPKKDTEIKDDYDFDFDFEDPKPKDEKKDPPNEVKTAKTETKKVEK